MLLRPHSARLALSASAIALSAFALPAPAAAATCNWGGGNGFWATILSWSCGAQPTSVDDTVITTAGSIVTVSGITANTGTLNLGSGNALNISNSNFYISNHAFTNNGTMTLAGAGAASLISGAGNVTITGTGTLALDDSAGIARIYGGGFIFGSGQTMRGSGQLGINQTIVSNAGLFSADVNGRTLDIDVSGGSGGVGAGNGFGTGGNAGLYNTGTMQATGGGTLALEGGLYENSATGVIQALAGSTVSLNGDSRIFNGTLSSVGSGVINAFSTTQYLTNVTLSSGSNLKVQNDNLYANTTLTNNGTITLGGAAGTASLINETGGTLAINGTGSIVLDNSQGIARIYNGNITFGAGQTVSGAGQLGINQTTFTINNVFSANTGATLDFDPTGGSGGLGGAGVGTGNNAGLLNNSTIQATGGSTISLEGGLYENSGAGVIQALAGSTLNLNGDARILNGTLTSVGTGVINAIGTNQYLTNVTLSSGSNLKVQNDNLYANTTLTNNGTITLGGAAGTASLINETGTLTLGGTGTIVLDNSAGIARIYGGNITIGASETVRGAGQLGVNQTVATNNGFITADAGTGTSISIDVSGGSGGLGGGGVGTGSNAGLLNNGVLSAINGSTLSIEGGLYENGSAGLGGELFVNGNGTVSFNGDASFENLKAGGVLDGGRIYAQGYGGTGTIDLRSNAANIINTIGVTGGNATEVILEGAGSVLEVTPFGGGAPVSIDQTLSGVADSGTFALHDRNFTVVANGGNFSNAGLVFVNNTVFTSNGFTNIGTLISDGTSSVTAPITNSGMVHVASGSLSTQAITGAAGTILIDNSATLNLGGTSTTGTLTNNGTLAIGTNNITVSSDYTNAHFGSGNAFNNHNNVTGTGQILALNATMTLSGPALSGNTLNVGNVRTGGSSSTSLTITNNGTATNLIGAVQNTLAPSVALSGANWSAAAGGGSATVGISYTGLVAGSLAGQKLNVVNNFDNVAAQTLNLAGNVYQAAQSGALPPSIALGARRVGDAAATGVLNIANIAPVTAGFNEALTANASVGNGFLLNGAGTASVANLAAGGSVPITLSHVTSVAGAFTDSIAIGNTSIAVAGSGLSNLALAGQTVNVASHVYATAIANVSPTTINFGIVRQGAAGPTGSVNITNGASGALTDSLVTSSSGLPAGVSASTPAPLAAGQSANAVYTLSTAVAGLVSGTGALNFTSHDSELSDVALASQTVNFTGIVTQLAGASLFKNTGVGTFAGSGNLYTLNLGTLASNSGTFADDLGVMNTTTASAFAEALRGSFTQSGGTGYSFAGNTFSNLSGGGQNIGNLLSFNTTGLSAGTYTKQITFNGLSQYNGLSDFGLASITLNITARINGIAGAVPEPSSWIMMIVGFGLVGGALRRKATAPASSACR